MRKRICQETGKAQFPSRLHAEIRILDVERYAGYPLYSYQCQHCGYWHFSKTPNFEALIELNLKAPTP